MDHKIEILEGDLLENVAGGEFGGSEHTTEVTNANYSAFIRSAVNVVVLFGVSWSNTCVRASDIIEKCAIKYPKIRVGVFDVTNSDPLMWINWGSKAFL
jgi:thioredoxin-like negative regulator of GroEL